jgi:DNA-binding CsgD family transcriptional regulator
MAGRDDKAAAFNALVARIYDAAAERALWSEAAFSVMRHFAAQSCIFVVGDAVRVRLAATTLNDRTQQQWAEHYRQVDSWNIGANRRPPGTAFRGHDLIPQQAYAESELYRDLARHDGAYWFLGGSASVDRAGRMTFGLHRPPDAKDFTPADQRQLQLLLPHLQTALRLTFRFESLEATASTGLAFLNSMRMGVAVVDATGRVLCANRAAEGIAAARDGFSLGSLAAGVAAARHDDTRRLHTAITRASAGGSTQPHALALSRPSGRRAYQVLVAPLPRRVRADAPAAVAALIAITDPEADARIPAERAAELYGLTPREAEMAALLAAGLSLDQAADRLAVTRETARTFVKSLLTKTGTRRQSQFVALLLQGPLGLLDQLGQ